MERKLLIKVTTENRCVNLNALFHISKLQIFIHIQKLIFEVISANMCILRHTDQF